MALAHSKFRPSVPPFLWSKQAIMTWAMNLHSLDKYDFFISLLLRKSVPSKPIAIKPSCTSSSVRKTGFQRHVPF